MKTPENQIKNDYDMQFIANTEEVRRLRIAQNITQERMTFVRWLVCGSFQNSFSYFFREGFLFSFLTTKNG
jgi:hypothetical protein